MMAVKILVLVFSVVVHEVAHGWAAWHLGDPTAREQGRLTLNPLPHLDPVGSVLVPLLLSFSGTIMLGWAKPVPVRPGRLHRPRDDYPKVAAAGPLSNLALALLAAVLLGLVAGVIARGDATPSAAGEFLLVLLQTAVLINVVLAVFNLLPLPPLDGSWILSRFLPPAARARYEGLRRYGFLLVIAFLLLARYTPVGGALQAGLIAAIHPFLRVADRVAVLIGA